MIRAFASQYRLAPVSFQFPLQPLPPSLFLANRSSAHIDEIQSGFDAYVAELAKELREER